LDTTLIDSPLLLQPFSGNSFVSFFLVPHPWYPYESFKRSCTSQRSQRRPQPNIDQPSALYQTYQRSQRPPQPNIDHCTLSNLSQQLTVAKDHTLTIIGNSDEKLVQCSMGYIIVWCTCKRDIWT